MDSFNTLQSFKHGKLHSLPALAKKLNLKLERLPVSIGDPALVTGSLMVCSMADVFQCFLQNGRIEVGFLGGAQVDRYGNINTTVIGSYERPAVRLPGSGGAVEIAYGRPAAASDARQCQVVVTDNGPGIPPAVLDRIFNPFFTTKDTGTGLGLSIVHRVVEAHDGTIVVTNREGGGAKFEVRF